MNKNELISAMAEKTGFTKKDLATVVDAITATMGETLAGGEAIKLSGFGTFSVSERAGRTGRNPLTGEQIEIPASKAVKFKPSVTLKETVNN